MPLSLSAYTITGVYLSTPRQLQLCVCVYTSYEEGGLQCNIGPCEAAADALVGPCVPGLDLGDQHCAVG